MMKKLQIKNLVVLLVLSLSFCLMSLAGYAQNRQITGKVTEVNGSPIPGVTVAVKGTSIGTITDVTGGFKLTVPASGTLVVSILGYTPQNITLGTSSVYNVKLESSLTSLDEVAVVAVGYGTTRKRDLTGAVSSVSAETIAKVPVPTLENALQGRAAGVQVSSNDGSPGGNTSVLIRGVGSLASGGNTPLYVVDGYPLNTGISTINPSDIASIDVLKDASATAIYGVRAANGVVIITTKKGRKDGTTVSVDAYTQVQSTPKTYKLLNAEQFGTLVNQQAAIPGTQFNGFAAYANPGSLTNADWQDAIYRTGLTQNYSVAVRGGNEKVQSATSLGYYDQKGIVLGSYFKRLTFGTNVDFQPVKWLKSSSSAKYTYQNANNPFGTGALGNITQLPPTLDGGNKVTSKISDGNGNYGFYNPIYTYIAKYGNPVRTIETNEYKNITNYFLVNSNLEATLFDGLKIKTNAGINYSGFSGSFFQPSDSRLTDQYGAAAGATGNAAYNQHINSTFDWLWENTLSYDKTFGKHVINFVAGVSEQSTTYNAMGGSVIPSNNTVRDLNQGTNLILDVAGNGQRIITFASQFARLNYKFNDRYLLTGTIRRDGSSKFADGHQYGIFPSGAVSWRIKQESFLKDVNWISDLKLRGSYGKIGNQGSIAPFQFDALYSSGAPASSSGNLGYPFGKVGGSNGTYYPGIAATQPANDNLRWETDYMTDIGLDLSLMRGDINITVDWFNRRSKDFLLTVPVPAQTGFNTLTKNVGSMSNKGVETAISYTHSTSAFNFGVTLTLSVIKNTLTSINAGTDFVGNFGGLDLAGPGFVSPNTYTKTYIGQPVGEFYGYKSIGIIQSQAQIDALNAAAVAKGFSAYYQAKTGPGDRLFADLNGDGHVTPDDQMSLGSSQPKFFGGINFDFGYKHFDVNAFFYGSYGNKILNYQETNLETLGNRSFSGIQNISQQYYQNAWTPQNSSNRYAAIHYSDVDYLNLVPSNVWIENGSFLKLKTLTVGYTLPAELVKKTTLSKIRVYVASQNLFTITKYTGLDPEIGIQGGNATQTGIDNGTYPSSKFFTVGLNVTF